MEPAMQSVATPAVSVDPLSTTSGPRALSAPEVPEGNLRGRMCRNLFSFSVCTISGLVLDSAVLITGIVGKIQNIANLRGLWYVPIVLGGSNLVFESVSMFFYRRGRSKKEYGSLIQKDYEESLRLYKRMFELQAQKGDVSLSRWQHLIRDVTKEIGEFARGVQTLTQSDAQETQALLQIFAGSVESHSSEAILDQVNKAFRYWSCLFQLLSSRISEKRATLESQMAAVGKNEELIRQYSTMEDEVRRLSDRCALVHASLLKGFGSLDRIRLLPPHATLETVQEIATQTLRDLTE